MENIKKTTFVVWIDEINGNNYIERLSIFLNPSYKKDLKLIKEGKGYLIKNHITTPMENKEVVFNKNTKKPYHTGVNRPMIVLDYDETKNYQLCYSISSPKSKDKENDLKYYFLPDGSKIVLTSPILVPNNYIQKLDLSNKKINLQTNIKWKDRLNNLNNDLIYIINHKEEIKVQANAIKNCITDYKFFPAKDVISANKLMIDTQKVEFFCKTEILILQNKEKDELLDDAEKLLKDDDKSFQDIKEAKTLQEAKQIASEMLEEPKLEKKEEDKKKLTKDQGQSL